MYTTHSASEYDRRPTQAARCGLARLLGAGLRDDAPPPGSCAGDAWSKVQAVSSNERELAVATCHPDVRSSVDAAWALGAARLMGISPGACEESPDLSGVPAPSVSIQETTEASQLGCFAPSDLQEVQPSDALDSASCVSDSSCDTESDEGMTQVSVFNLRGEENALEVPRYWKKTNSFRAGTESRAVTGPGARTPPHPEVESGWGSPHPATRALCPPALSPSSLGPSPERERERAMLGMSAHRQARLDRRTHAQRVCLMARFGLLDQPRTPLPGPDAHVPSRDLPAVSMPPVLVLELQQPIYKR